jgi:hypothetical protein
MRFLRKQSINDRAAIDESRLHHHADDTRRGGHIMRRTRKSLIVVAAVCVAMFASIVAGSPVAHAASASHVASVPHAAVQPLSSGCYLVITYNYGSNLYCVNKTGYNGINVALYNVTKIQWSTCTSAFWILWHNSETSPGIKASFSGGSPYYISISLYKLTQVDVYGTSCTP